MTDLMDRLRAADPVTEEPPAPDVYALLGRLEEPRRRRLLVPALAAVAAVAAVVVGTSVGGSSPDALAAARKALAGNGEIVHMVTKIEMLDPSGNPLPQGSYRVDGREAKSDGRSERWIALDPLRMRSRIVGQPTDGGAPLVFDWAYADGVAHERHTGSDKIQAMPLSNPEDFDRVMTRVTPDRPGADPLAGVRELLASGELREAGETTFDGRRVLRLTGKDVEYLVDAQTYTPVQITQHVDLMMSRGERETGTMRTTFESYERLPMLPENEALLVLE